jgi:hypothetical protein
MKVFRYAAPAVALLSYAFSAPAMAQDAWPFDLGDFVEVAGIDVDDGHDLDYANHLAGLWKKGQDYAKQQGWITSYEVLQNQYPRKGEPDIYLVTHFPNFASPAEEDKRDAAYRAYMASTISQLEAASGERAKYRTQTGSMLLRELKFK